MTFETTLTFESTDRMTEPCRRGLEHLLLGCADTKLLLGYHYGEWTFGPPALEAAIANCSLAQGELGHVRLLHALLSGHFGIDLDALTDRRAAADFANVAYLDQALATWPAFVAANAVVDLAVSRVLNALRDSTFKPLRMSVDKMLDEERYHAHHGRGWFRTVAAADAESRARLAEAVRRALAAVVTWLGPEGHEEDEALVTAGVTSEPIRGVRDALYRDLEQLADGTDLALEGSPVTLDGWDPATRRVTPGGPDEDILRHLKGSKNAIFKLR